MNFKNISLLMIICSLIGCSDFLKGRKKEQEVLKFSQDRFACLNKVPESLRNVLSDKSQPEAFEETLTCLESSLTYFKKRTKGNVPDGYSVQDIRAFFGNYLGDRDRVSDSMASQLMKIKKALFGGTQQVITKSELQSLIDLLTNVREEVQPIKPYWDIIIVKNSAKPSKEMMEQSHKVLKEALNRLVLKTHLVRSDYSFTDFKAFVGELEKFVKRSPGKSSVQFIRWLPVIEAVKIHLFSDFADMGTIAKWKEAISQLLELYRIYTIYKYQYKGHEFYSPQAFQAGDDMLVAVISLLDKSWWMEKEGIPFTATMGLLNAMEGEEILPDKTTAQTVYQAYTTVVRNILDRSPNKKEIKIKALNRKHISMLKSEYRGFKAVQSFIDSQPSSFSYADLVKNLDQIKYVPVDTFSEESDDLLILSWNDWNTHIKQVHPLLYLKTGELLLDRDAKKSSEWSWVGLTRLNIMKFLNRMLMLGFGTKQSIDLSKEVLNEGSMRGFYNDFWDFAVMLRAFDDRSGNSGKRTYFEADHFVYAANGDGDVTLQESFELVNVVFSAGLSGLNQIQKDLKKSICALQEKDYFDNPWLDEKCFQKILRENFGNYFKNLINFKKWIATLNDSEWNSFYKEFSDFSRVNPAAAGRVETGDLRTMVVIAHYIESMYIKFDQDEDDRLSISELIKGSERFAPFFKELFKLEPKGPFLRETQENLIDFTIKRAFACMVITGQVEMPKLIKSCTPALFNDAVRTKPYSNRTLILRTLNAFKSSIK